jgi:hypothetical protein
MSDTTTRFLLALPGDLLAAIDAMAERERLTRSAYVRQLLERAVDGYDPQLMIGYWQVVGGELATDDECAGCGNPIGPQPWMGIDAAYHISGPLCGSCASSD